MFTKVLIAERGDLATRVARTCERLGVATVGVQSASDIEAERPSECDETVVLDEGPLQVEALLEAAQKHEVQAVHPGGGLPDASTLAIRLAEASIAFVGPKPELLAQLQAPDGLAAIATQAGVRGQLPELPERVRYLSATLVGDGEGDGGVIVIGDHETSLEDEHGTLIEEASAPGLTFLTRGEDKREILDDCARRLGEESALRGLARIGFLLDVEGGLHLRDISPYLEPAHAMMEARSGLDFVELQLRLASGEPLPADLRSRRLAGHAAAAYLRSEATAEATPLASLRFPPLPPGTLRIESALSAPTTLNSSGQLIAHVVTHHQTRHEALLSLDRVLAEAILGEAKTNRPLLRAILADEAFRAGQYDTSFAATVVP